MFILSAVQAIDLDAPVQLDVTVLSRLAGFVIPIITAVVTKKLASSQFKALTTLVFAVVLSGVTTALAADGQVVLGTWLDSMFWTFVTAAAAYYGLWKPTGATGAIASFWPTGIGTPKIEVTPAVVVENGKMPAKTVEQAKAELLEQFTKESLYKQAVNLGLDVKPTARKDMIAQMIADKTVNIATFPE